MANVIDDLLLDAYSNALDNDKTFNFKRGKDGYLVDGICPECKKKELFASSRKPWQVKCNRLSRCGYEETTSSIYPEIVEGIIEDLKHSEDPSAQAKAYMRYTRGFDSVAVESWFEQEVFKDSKTGRSCPTVRFWIDKARNCYWERLIGMTKANGQRHNIRANPRKLKATDKDHRDFNGTKIKGCWWVPPTQKITKGDEVYLVEGIFHAIALHLSGYKVAATLAAGYFPELEIRKHYRKSILWIWALDDDNAGHEAMRKHRRKMEGLGELTTMALTGSEHDWDDLYKSGELSKDKPKFMEKCRYRGLMACAVTTDRKSFIHFRENRKSYFVFDHKSYMYSAAINKDELDEEAIQQVDIEGDYNHKHIPPEFVGVLKIRKISSCFPQMLYVERNQLSRELSFFFRVNFGNGAPRVQESLKKEAMESAKSFHRNIIGLAGGSCFRGTEKDFELMYEAWFPDREASEEVRAVNYMGYDKDFCGYVFGEFGYKNGNRIKVNEYSLIKGDGEKVKSTLKGVNFALPEAGAQCDWLDDIYTGFGINGLITIAFWLGSFFSEQIRSKISFYPFLEMSGPPGTGKSSILEYLWKASGRTERYEGINPTKYSAAARGKTMTKLSGMPMVLIEGDTGEAKQKFDINEMKDAFNGGPVRGIGLPTGGSETIEPPFKCGFIVAQNAEIDCEAAMVSRFIHLHWTEAHFSREGKNALDRFKAKSTEDACIFLHKSLANEKKILNTIFSEYEKNLKEFSREPGISMPRIQETHALTVACFNAMAHVFKGQADKYKSKVKDFLIGRAKSRQLRMVADHPDIQTFWEVYELIKNKTGKPESSSFAYAQDITEKNFLNHAKEPGLIAINLSELLREAEVQRYRLPIARDLKRLLHSSTRYKYVELKTIRSAITDSSKFCWIFENKKEE